MIIRQLAEEQTARPVLIHLTVIQHSRARFYFYKNQSLTNQSPTLVKAHSKNKKKIKNKKYEYK